MTSIICLIIFSLYVKIFKKTLETRNLLKKEQYHIRQKKLLKNALLIVSTNIICSFPISILGEKIHFLNISLENIQTR